MFKRLIPNRTYRTLISAALGLMVTLGLSFLGGCQSPVTSLETAQSALNKQVLPNINVASNLVPDELASRYTVDQIAEPLPNIDDFPIYGASPQADQVYLEIYSSSEKANIDRQNERWLVEVAEAFNQRQEKSSSGKVIQVGIRKIASGTAARLLGAGAVQPAGYSPSNDLWVSMIISQGIKTTPVAERLVANTAGWVVPGDVYQQLQGSGDVSFDSLLNAIAAGQVSVAYPNPYKSSTALNLLYTLYWRAAGHQKDGGALTKAELQTPQVKSVFDQFQSQVLITTPTTLELQELFLRDQTKLQAFPLEYQNYLALKQVAGFESTEFIPFGIPHNNPLVGFDWNNPETAAALQQFAAFAQSPDMVQLANNQGFVDTDYLKATHPPIPDGETLLAAQSSWKINKDSGRTVYLEMVIDTSGSMDGEPLQAVQAGLRVASQQINQGNQVGLVTFADQPVRRLALTPYDELQQKKLLAAIDQLQADGGTAMYDGVMVALADLMEKRANDPNGRFYLLLLSDGEVNEGHLFRDVKDIMEYSDVRFYPIAYGNVNEAELQAIASLRESTVKQGNPENVQTLFKDLFQVNL
ncbi:von willebrand factor a [Leptolyngbya sp. Heron Island J]|uniref:vWA domain-containing protein n=1 Tax=Leptolyngbya sp. Heron Island J TaxID=1385935 RepID=UPI0003B9CBE7|nr:vWA domain-containing protein [Leptolyngbya sp. Heron Island J]ESA35854.1 von willebrand factor a [Leptolyngbya sp. Heron Island J]